MLVPALLVVGIAMLLWALWSRLFRRATLNGPIVMTALGVIGAILLPVQGPLFMESKTTLFVAEVILALLLFVDAVDVRGSLRSQFTGVPVRLLGIGLPLSLILVLAVGFGAAPGTVGRGRPRHRLHLRTGRLLARDVPGP